MNIINNYNKDVEKACVLIDEYIKTNRISKRRLFIDSGLSIADYIHFVGFRTGTYKTYSVKKLQKLIDYILKNK